MSRHPGVDESDGGERSDLIYSDRSSQVDLDCGKTCRRVARRHTPTHALRVPRLLVMPESSTTSEASTQVHKVAQAELRSLPAARRVYQKRSGLFFRADKQKVLAETVGKIIKAEAKKQ